jgi:hypothetical protein
MDAMGYFRSKKDQTQNTKSLCGIDEYGINGL